MTIETKAIEAACRAHAPQWDGIDPEIQVYARQQMQAAIEAYLTALVGAKVTPLSDAIMDERKRAVAAIHWVFSADGTKLERSMADEAINKINDPSFMPDSRLATISPAGDVVGATNNALDEIVTRMLDMALVGHALSDRTDIEADLFVDELRSLVTDVFVNNGLAANPALTHHDPSPGDTQGGEAEHAFAEFEGVTAKELAATVARYGKALRSMQEAAGLAIEALPVDQQDGTVGDFLASIHWHCASALSLGHGGDFESPSLPAAPKVKDAP